MTLAIGLKRIEQAIGSIDIGYGTDLDAPLVLAGGLLHRVRKQPVHCILLTDGLGGQPLPTAVALKGNGVVIETIGVGHTPAAVDEPLLKAMASVVEGRVLYRFIRDRNQLVHYFRHEVAGRLVRIQ